jgi:hypothetical protein
VPLMTWKPPSLWHLQRRNGWSQSTWHAMMAGQELIASLSTWCLYIVYDACIYIYPQFFVCVCMCVYIYVYQHGNGSIRFG